jgi:hypothetical protein
MGWKTLKDAFGIEKHTVSLTSAGICIGGGYVSDLVTINVETGTLKENRSFEGFVTKTYPLLAQAAPSDLLALIQADDKYSATIPVFTYEGSRIVEKECEKPGWPNVTHDGEVMYENTFSTDRTVVIGWAKREAQARIELTTDYVARLKAQLMEAEADLEKARGDAVKLEADYP